MKDFRMKGRNYYVWCISSSILVIRNFLLNVLSYILSFQIVKATLEDASNLNLYQAQSLTELSVLEIPPQFVPLLLV